MKHILTLFFILTVLISKAQDHSFLTLGVGYPVFLDTRNSEDPHYAYFINNKNYNLFLEKELKFQKLTPEVSFVPGLAFSHITENYDFEGLGGGGKADFKHKALSGYLKLLYKIDRQPEILTDYYFGLHFGYYLHSETSGSKSSWQMNSEGGNYSSSTEIDKSGKDFFHSSHIGIMAGIKPLGSRASFIQPKIELAFYPAFATLNSYFVNGEEKKNMVQISVSIGVGKSRKKE